MLEINCLLNPNFDTLDKTSSHLVSPEIIEQVTRFHQSIPNYKKAPLIDLRSLSQSLEVSHLFVKDESHRFELNAFKRNCHFDHMTIVSYLPKTIPSGIPR